VVAERTEEEKKKRERKSFAFCLPLSFLGFDLTDHWHSLDWVLKF
jgi:hypothetical protein